MTGRTSRPFAPSFVAAVPEAEIRTTLASLREAHGAVVEVEPGRVDGRWNLLTDTHRVSVDLARDGEGYIVGLKLDPPLARGGDLDGALAALANEGTRVGWVLLADGERRAGENADVPLAVGSAFKLFVLDALRRAAEAGAHARDDVVTLERRHRSHPGGILQDWPAGTPLTLGTLAQLMISRSDNTATDLLVETLGREAVESASPFAPLLTTRELFVLRGDAGLETRYARADEDGRRALLDGLAGHDLPPLPSLSPAPLEGVEWYASAAGAVRRRRACRRAAPRCG